MENTAKIITMARPHGLVPPTKPKPFRKRSTAVTLTLRLKVETGRKAKHGR